MDRMVAVTVGAGGSLQFTLCDMSRMDAIGVAFINFAVAFLADLLHGNRQLATRLCIDLLMRKAPDALLTMAVGAAQRCILNAIEHPLAVHRMNNIQWIDVQADRLARRQRQLAAQQAMTGLAFGVFALRRAGVTGLARLAGAEVADQFGVNVADLLVLKLHVTLLTGANRVGNHGCGRRHFMTAMTVDAVWQVGFVLRLKMTRIVQQRRCMTLLTVLRDFRLELTDVLSRILAVRILITLPWAMTIGAIDRRCSARAMYGLFQHAQIDASAKDIAGWQRHRRCAVGMTKPARRIWARRLRRLCSGGSAKQNRNANGCTDERCRDKARHYLNYSSGAPALIH